MFKGGEDRRVRAINKDRDTENAKLGEKVEEQQAEIEGLRGMLAKYSTLVYGDEAKKGVHVINRGQETYRGSSRSSGSSRVVGHYNGMRLWTAIAIILLMVVGSGMCDGRGDNGGKKAMVCQVEQGRMLLRIPQSVECSSYMEGTGELNKILSVFRPNSVEYKSEGKVCRVTKEKVKYYTSLMGTEYLQREQPINVEVDRGECMRMIKNGKCAYGNLEKVGSLMKTSNGEKITFPHWSYG
jgi:hypothetical protein